MRSSHVPHSLATVAACLTLLAADAGRSLRAPDLIVDVEAGLDVVCVVSRAGGLQVLDARSSGVPVELARIGAGEQAGDVALDGHAALLARGRAGASLIDLRQPRKPRMSARVPALDSVVAVDLTGEHAYLVEAGVLRVFLRDAFELTELGRVDVGPRPRRLHVVGSVAYLTDHRDGLLTIDVSNPRRPRVSSQTPTRGYAYDVAVSGVRAYVADASGVLVLDVSDPLRPQPLGRLGDGNATLAVSIADGLAFAADGFRGLRIFDASTVQRVEAAEAPNTGGAGVPHLDVDYAQHVRVLGDTVYVAARAELRLFHVPGPAAIAR